MTASAPVCRKSGAARRSRWLGLALAATLVEAGPRAYAAADQPAGKSEADAIIFERQQLMTRLDENTEILGKIAAGTLPPTKLAEAARAIAEDAKDAKRAFQPDVPGGHAKPEVWSNWVDFSRRLDEFADKSGQMAKIADSGNLSGVMEIMVTALPCKECHDTYREKKRPDPQ